jgi:hypothetical protein
MTDTDENLIEIDFKAQEQPAIKRRSKPTPCRHGVFELDYDSRRVYCAMCDEEIDPFNALARIEEDWSRHAATNKLRKAEAKRLEGEIDDIKRRKRNAKAALRRLEKGAGFDRLKRTVADAFRALVAGILESQGQHRESLIQSGGRRLGEYTVTTITEPTEK